MFGKTQARQAQIITLIEAEGALRVEVLSERLGVSAQTVRRDLAHLHEQNLLQRRHGRAEQLVAEAQVDAGYDQRSRQNQQAKALIARHAARLIPNEATVFLSIGTSLVAMATALRDHQRLTIVTNNLRAAMELDVQAHRLILAGGELRRPEGDFVDRGACDLFEKYRADFGIYGVAGIAADGTLLDFNSVEIEAREAIRANSQTSILIADHSKFGRRAPAVGGRAEDATHIVTDRTLSPEFSELEQCLGQKLVLASEDAFDAS